MNEAKIQRSAMIIQRNMQNYITRRNLYLDSKYQRGSIGKDYSMEIDRRRRFAGPIQADPEWMIWGRKNGVDEAFRQGPNVPGWRAITTKPGKKLPGWYNRTDDGRYMPNPGFVFGFGG